MDFKERLLGLEHAAKLVEDEKRAIEEKKRLELIKTISDEVSALFDPEINRILAEIDSVLGPFKEKLASLGFADILSRLGTDLELKDPLYETDIFVNSPSMVNVREYNLEDYLNNMKSQGINQRLEIMTKKPDVLADSDTTVTRSLAWTRRLIDSFFGEYEPPCPPRIRKVLSTNPRYYDLDRLVQTTKNNLEVEAKTSLKWNMRRKEFEYAHDGVTYNRFWETYYSIVYITYTINSSNKDYSILTVSAYDTEKQKEELPNQKIYNASNLTKPELEEMVANVFFARFREELFH